MPSFTTIYRAIVMVAAGVIVVKGWQLYGPPPEQVKAFGTRALEMAQTAWNESRQAGETSGADGDPRTITPPATAPQPPAVAELAPLYSAPENPADSVDEPATEVAPPLATGPVSATESDNTLPSPIVEADRLPILMSRLEELGAVDPQLAAWGTSGQLYRFCCRAALADTPAYARHFEAVADEPHSAVEQVVAKVEAWRAAQREHVTLR